MASDHASGSNSGSQPHQQSDSRHPFENQEPAQGFRAENATLAEADSTGEAEPLLQAVAAPVKAPMLNSPLMQRSLNPEDFSGTLSYKPPAVSRPLVDLLIAVFAISAFALVMCWLIGLEKAGSPFSTKEALIQAQSAIAKGEFDQSIEILDRMAVVRSSDLTVAEKSVLDEALYQRAKVNLQRKRYRLALSDLLRLTPASPNYSAALKLIHQYSALADKEASVKSASIAAPGSGDAGTQSGVPPQIESNSRKRKQAGLSLPAAPGHKAPGKTVSRIQPAETAPRVVVEKVPNGLQVKSTRWNYADADVARYNKMLADYFSPERLGTRRSIKDSLGVNADNHEPPPFQDWLDAGKPNF